MQTSAQGIAALEYEEGVVLRAYRDAVGVWTIGAGLTAASGVVAPKAGMVITHAEATNLLQRALREKYEPAVAVAMSRVDGKIVTRPKQHEFDAGVSFHFNTGAIRKASWVRKWLARAPRAEIIAALALWNKGGGKVLPGLVGRRDREARMLLDGTYARQRTMPRPEPGPTYARWGVPVSITEAVRIRSALAKLGYDVGAAPDRVLEEAARRFQLDHGLTVDGIIGRATLSTLQRRLDAPKAAAKPATAAAPAALIPATDVASAYVDGLGVSGVEWAALGLVALWGLSTAWRYRDVIAAKIARPAPRLATFLRSF